MARIPWQRLVPWSEGEKRRRRAERALPKSRPQQVALALAELQRRTEELSRRSESMSARSGVLIASAALVATLQQGRDPDLWLVGAAIAALLSAGLGVAAIFPRTIRYPDIMDTRAELFRRHYVADGQWWLVDRLADQYSDASKHLQTRGRLLRAGFVVLALSILLTAGSVVSQYVGEVISVGKEDLNPSEVPPVSPNEGKHEFAEHGGAKPGSTRDDSYFGSESGD